LDVNIQIFLNFKLRYLFSLIKKRSFCSNKKGLSEIGWTILYVQNQTKQKLTDAWNCGVYCCKYLEAIIESSGENIDLKFKNTMLELKAIRKNMHLILKTELKLI